MGNRSRTNKKLIELTWVSEGQEQTMYFFSSAAAARFIYQTSGVQCNNTSVDNVVRNGSKKPIVKGKWTFNARLVDGEDIKYGDINDLV